MRFNRMAVGAAVSLLLFIPVGMLDLSVAFDNSIGNWAFLFLALPYLIYFGLAAGLRWRDYAESAKGVAIGGAVLSTLIICGILFIAFTLGMLTEFG